MGDLADNCFHISRSQGISYLREIRDNDDTVSILRGVAPSGRTSVATRIIWMPPDGVL